MNRYFEELFASFNEEEENRMWEMIVGVEKKNLPYHLWKDSLTDSPCLRPPYLPFLPT